MDYLQEIIKNVKEVVKIDSVERPATDGKPFGEGVYKALKFMLGLGDELGFKTVNYDNYIGEIVWGDDENEAMAILCHLDVVPVGNLSDWKYPPFSATEADGKIYGRGTTDDKSPAVVVLYCMKALMDEGFKPSKTVKLILGCDEESGWECVKHYKEVAKMPDFGFSPDADFPVIYAEKGILQAEYTFKCNGKLYSVDGGTRANVVCDYCQFRAEKNVELLNKYGISEVNGSFETHGVTAHGSTPDKGKNAIKPVLEYLADIGAIDKEVPNKLFADSLHLKDMEDETGRLTMSPDIIRKEGDSIVITVDFRYPSTLKPEYVLFELGKIGEMKVISHQLPLYNDKNGQLVQTLLKVYNEYTGCKYEPIAIGGGTYARVLNAGIAFGPEFPGEEETIHQPNEYVKVENLSKCFDIYKKTIYELTK